MTPRLLVLALAPLAAAGTARAQAPGEVAPEMAPPGAGDPCARPSVMAHRFAIGLSLGGFGVASENAPDGAEAEFHVGELALRFRATRRLELELAMSGGRQVLDDGNDGDLATGSVTLGLRYRFMPERRWNWWVMGGLGAMVIAPHESNADERDAAQRPLGMLGIGIERRFRRFALQAELRMVGLGPSEDPMPLVKVEPDGGGTPPPRDDGAPIFQEPIIADELSGGMFTIGASYYF